jgi:hypothetical protein
MTRLFYEWVGCGDAANAMLMLMFDMAYIVGIGSRFSGQSIA